MCGVAFSLLLRIFRERSTIHSLPAFFCFFKWRTDLLCTVDSANKPLVVLVDAVERVVSHAHPGLHCLLTHFHQLLGQPVCQYNPESTWAHHWLILTTRSNPFNWKNSVIYGFSCALLPVDSFTMKQKSSKSFCELFCS